MVRLAAGLVLLAVAPVLVAPAQAPRPPRTVTITAATGRFALSAESIGAGAVTFELRNRSSVIVSAQLLAVRNDHTPAEAMALLAGGAPLPEWVTAAGGVAAVSPGARAAVTHNLPPGSYVVASTMPDSAGTPQHRRGYVTAFRATGSSSAMAEVPGVIAVVTAGNNGIRLVRVADVDGKRIELQRRQRGRPFPIGEQVIELEFAGSLSHEMSLVKLDATVPLRRYTQWLSGGQRGAAPGRPAGGVAITPPGRRAWMRVSIEPGNYWLFCGAIHRGGRRGYELGEYSQISAR